MHIIEYTVDSQHFSSKFSFVVASSVAALSYIDTPY